MIDGLDYDASWNEMFCMHLALLWMIINFTTHAVLLDWSTIGMLACPCYMNDSCYERLTYSRKQVYMGLSLSGTPPSFPT